MFRIDVDLAGTNENFAIDCKSAAEATAVIDEAVRVGYIIQSRHDGAVKIYHPIACVRRFLVQRQLDMSKFAPK